MNGVVWQLMEQTRSIVLVSYRVNVWNVLCDAIIESSKAHFILETPQSMLTMMLISRRL